MTVRNRHGTKPILRADGVPTILIPKLVPAVLPAKVRVGLV